jgi:DNA gyrase subunit A
MSMTPDSGDTESVALHEATRHRYLNYAMSVITSRALPDVRDGLKPVQRRILYAMYHNLRLLPDGRYRKSAAVVGEVMAKYHPHGDSSIYEAMVRLAQPFSMRHMLVDGQGNFGSMDGDGAAAMRYTECKLRPLAVELLDEIKKRTVDFRPNYDGQSFEPIVLPSQFPQLLVNGCEGIAVGMATRIPPHNLRAIIDACMMLIEDPDVSIKRLATKVKAPDFPTGGIILNDGAELRSIYETGHGAVRLQGTWTTEKHGRKNYVIVTSIPYSVNKSTLIEKIGTLIAEKKVPQLVDVRDESTDEVRIVLELRKSHDAPAAMAYLFKRTPLQTNFNVNLTCLIPVLGSDVPQPERTNLRKILWQWLIFRHATVRRRFEYELEKLRERIHILEGFEIVFNALDEAIRIIRGSEGKRDAAEQLMVRFDLDDVQTEAILELKLYKIAKLEILTIREELAEKRAEATRIEAILASDTELWNVVQTELTEIRKLYGEPRRTEIGIEQPEVSSYSEADYIVAEKTYVIVTRDGWIKRQGSFTDIEKIRTREGDRIGWIGRASTKSTISFFGDQGSAYVLRIDDIPSTTGYGEPVQRHFTFDDGERVVGVILNDERSLPTISTDLNVEANTDTDDGGEPIPPPPHCIAVTRKGRCIRFALSSHKDVSTKNGRRYMRPAGDDDAVVAVYVTDTTEQLSIASESTRALTFPVQQAKFIRGAGKGVIAIKLRDGDSVLAFELTQNKFEGALVKTPQGREETIRPSKFAGNRAARGKEILKRGRFVEWEEPILRYDQLHAITEEDEDAPDDDPEGGGGSNEEGGGNQGTTQNTSTQQGLPLPFGQGGDA